MSHQYNPAFFSRTHQVCEVRLDQYHNFRLVIDGDKLELETPPYTYPEGWDESSWVAEATSIVESLQGIVDAVKEKVECNPRAGFCAAPHKMGGKLSLGFEFSNEDPALLKWLNEVFDYDPASLSMLDHFRLRYSPDTPLKWGDHYHSEWYYESYSGTVIHSRDHYGPDVQTGQAPSDTLVKVYLPVKRAVKGREHYESLMAL